MAVVGRSRPLVAVAPVRVAPGRVADWTDSAEVAGTRYLSALRRAGSLPAVIGGPDDCDPADVLEPFSGLVLLGGSDVDPAWYGEERDPRTYGVDTGRDRFEMGLARAAIRSGLPVLAICRGLQLLNVALGGTLHQHLPDAAETIAHGVPVGAGAPAQHAVRVEHGTRLAAIEVAGGRLDRCVSVHHQGVAAVAPGLAVVARSDDGVVEALETPAGSGGWCVAVQWHPERSASVDPAQQAVFGAFVDAAAEWAGVPARR